MDSAGFLLPRLHPGRLPGAASAEDAARGFEQWNTLAGAQQPVLAEFMRQCAEDAAPHALLAALFGNAPFLSRLVLTHPELVRQINRRGPDACHNDILSMLRTQEPQALKTADLMPFLRRAKAEVALLAAIADIAGIWELSEVTGHLSTFADAALQLTVETLLAQAARRGEIVLQDEQRPSHASGLIVLGMGKLGAGELNYSSDIDLIIFYEPGRVRYNGRQTEQHFFNRLTHDLVQVMQERTPEGYVFRTDIRLRPDPASTPPAITVGAAISYYESVGQNWERAAMIKARPVAGDMAAGEAFLHTLAPFLWRRNLDFAAIQDIHSIKRQMDGRGGRGISLPGNNIKLGVGGIREIEFFTQVHQLIWGGRMPRLRVTGTCEALLQLVAAGLVEEPTAKELIQSYGLLRHVEHRLQMIADQQTHTLPENPDELNRTAIFIGYPSASALAEKLLPVMQQVHDTFASSFRSAEGLGSEGSLVFTGVSDDPDTLSTLMHMGYKQPERVSEMVMGWHHGSHRCTRTKRARELLTELMPALLRRIGQTADPDAAFLKFDEFLSRVPVGAQLFSLFAAHPPLLGLIADIMGSAPVLADTLARHPDLLDSVLYSDFYDPLPSHEQLAAQLKEMLSHAEEFESCMEFLRRFKNERQFQGGVQLLEGIADAPACAQFLTRLADVILQQTLTLMEKEFAAAYGRVAGGRFTILSLGRLGGGEMAFGSDIDLVFVYDAPDVNALSRGPKPLSASLYYNRLAQRIHGALTLMGREGRLYEADIRLRPSGAQGLSAISIEGLEHYFDTMAWTFEFMALAKARPVAGDASLKGELEALVARQLCKPRNEHTLRTDVAEMRSRVAKEFPPTDIWDLKHAAGGLMELEFLCHYLLLRHANAAPEVVARNADGQLPALRKAGFLSPHDAAELLRCHAFLNRLLHIMRLSAGGHFAEAHAMPGLKHLLASATGCADFAALKVSLLEVEKTVHSYYIKIVETDIQEDHMTSAAAPKPTTSNLKAGDKAPLFNLKFDSGSKVTPESLKGKHTVLYFYPKDDTPGCTVEAKDFRDHLKEFEKANTVIIGVSKDSVASHDKFREKYCLPFPLGSDENGSVCEDYGVWGEKSMYGKTYMGIDRTTFLIDKTGIIRHVWRKVKVEGHVKEVLDAVKALQ